MELSLIDKKSKISVSDRAFGREFNESLVHQAVIAYLAGARSGTKQNKRRSDVRGGGAKPWRQKGTGRARAGTIRSPLWRGGGVTFAARPRDHSQKLNKKMVKAAYSSIFSELIRQQRMQVISEFSVSAPKTKELVEKLSKLALGSVLIITHEQNQNLYLAARNLSCVEIAEVGALSPASLVQYENVLITEPALKQIEGWLA